MGNRTPKYRYSNNCSCCGSYIDDTLFENGIRPEDNKDVEGNLCSRCYYEQIIENWFQIKEMIELVASKLHKPINKFKFLYKPIEEQYRICMNLMDKGLITWKIT